MTTKPIYPVLVGQEPDQDEMYVNMKPVRYRYVMAYLHDEMVGGQLHRAGEVMYVLPMTTVTYGVGMYAGTEMSGNIYLPSFYMDLMVHQPSNVYEHRRNPEQQGTALGSLFECGNRAIYVMRNDKVVWGGILWSRSYASGTPMLAITALSWDAYIYYRLLRQSIVFNPAINMYTIWYAVLKQTLTDFTWRGVPYQKNGNTLYRNNGMLKKAAADATRFKKDKDGHIKRYFYTRWTGITRGTGDDAHSNANFIDYQERWRNNSPNIELPDAELLLWSNPSAAPADRTEVKAEKEFRGYDMNKVGPALEEWADTETLTSVAGGKRFEYRVVCWFDTSKQIFRQRYVFGDMRYAAGKGPDTNNPTPDKILSPRLGKNTKTMARSKDNKLIFDYPGHIASWTLSESNDAAATRVIVTDGLDAASKHAVYASQRDLLNKPSAANATADQKQGSQGWPLYDQSASYDIKKKIVTTLRTRAQALLRLFHVAEAQQINDLASSDDGTQRTSERATSFSVSLYTAPHLPLPEFEVGDWATFAIDDPFYGGKMYLVRRIVGYTVTVVPEQESDYSHEQVELELTDDTQVELG